MSGDVLSLESVLSECVWFKNSPIRKHPTGQPANLTLERTWGERGGRNEGRLIRVGSCRASKLRRRTRSRPDSQLARSSRVS